MDFKDDKILERLTGRIGPVQLATTLEMVKREASRRCVEDGQARVVYAVPDGSLKIRFPMKDVEGDQKTICYIDGTGEILVLGADFDEKERY